MASLLSHLHVWSLKKYTSRTGWCTELWRLSAVSFCCWQKSCAQFLDHVALFIAFVFCNGAINWTRKRAQPNLLIPRSRYIRYLLFLVWYPLSWRNMYTNARSKLNWFEIFKFNYYSYSTYITQFFPLSFSFRCSSSTTTWRCIKVDSLVTVVPLNLISAMFCMFLLLFFLLGSDIGTHVYHEKASGTGI